jgi:hypothetical protein
MGFDPVAKFGDRTYLFELPPGELTTLIRAPEVELLGSVFEGQGPWEQWFHRIVLTVPARDRFLEIRVKGDLHLANQSLSPRSDLSTLDITMGYGDPAQPWATAKVRDFSTPVPLSLLGYHVVIRRLRRDYHVTHTSVGRFPRECADIAGAEFHVYICSTPANEYYGELRHLALKFAHLDMSFHEVYDASKLAGLLPELWGLQPMSESTRATIKKNLTVNTTMKVTANPSLKPWAGGNDSKNLAESCLGSEMNSDAKVVFEPRSQFAQAVTI